MSGCASATGDGDRQPPTVDSDGGVQTGPRLTPCADSEQAERMKKMWSTGRSDRFRTCLRTRPGKQRNSRKPESAACSWRAFDLRAQPDITRLI